jgi:hypothetical protein
MHVVSQFDDNAAILTILADKHTLVGCCLSKLYLTSA